MASTEGGGAVVVSIPTLRRSRYVSIPFESVLIYMRTTHTGTESSRRPTAYAAKIARSRGDYDGRTSEHRSRSFAARVARLAGGRHRRYGIRTVRKERTKAGFESTMGDSACLARVRSPGLLASGVRSHRSVRVFAASPQRRTPHHAGPSGPTRPLSSVSSGYLSRHPRVLISSAARSQIGEEHRF